MMRVVLILLLIFTVALAATRLEASPEKGSEPSPFGDLQVRSETDATEISLEVPKAVVEEDRTQKRPGLSASGQPARVTQRPERTPTPEAIRTPQATETPEAKPTEVEGRGARGPKRQFQPAALTVNEIHLFFPGMTIPRARLITVDDRIVQEARLFPDEGGVSMTVVARRPIFYVVSRDVRELHIRVEPGTLLAEEPTAPTAERTPSGPRAGMKAPRERGPGGQQRAPIQGEQLLPKVSMPGMR